MGLQMHVLEIMLHKTKHHEMLMEMFIEWMEIMFIEWMEMKCFYLSMPLGPLVLNKVLRHTYFQLLDDMKSKL